VKWAKDCPSAAIVGEKRGNQDLAQTGTVKYDEIEKEKKKYVPVQLMGR